jgi:hypothetical protein
MVAAVEIPGNKPLSGGEIPKEIRGLKWKLSEGNKGGLEWKLIFKAIRPYARGQNIISGDATREAPPDRRRLAVTRLGESRRDTREWRETPARSPAPRHAPTHPTPSPTQPGARSHTHTRIDIV